MQNGENSNDIGVINAKAINQKYSLEVYDESTNVKYIIIKTSYERMDIVSGLTEAEKLYNATKNEWKNSPNKAKKFPYVLSAIDGVVKEIYKVKNDGKTWCILDDGRMRYYFEGVIAPMKLEKYLKDILYHLDLEKKGCLILFYIQ